MQQFLPWSPAQGSLGLKGWEGNRLPSGSCLASTDSLRQVLGVGLALEMAGARAVAPHLPSSTKAATSYESRTYPSKAGPSPAGPH